MKKILAIAISLVMVFAVAASALALFGFPANATPVLVDEISVDVEIYDIGRTSASNSMIRGFYPVHVPTSGVRDGDEVIGLVTLDVPDFDTLTATGKSLLNGTHFMGEASMRIECENVTKTLALAVPADGDALGLDDPADLIIEPTLNGATGTFEDYEIDVTTINGAVGTPIDDATDLDTDGTTICWLVTGLVKKLADATITATFGSPDPDMGAATGATTCMIGNWGVFFAANVYTMEEWSSAGALNGNQVIFSVSNADSAGNRNILDTFVSNDAGTTTWRVSQDPTTGAIIFTLSGTGVAVTDADQYNVLSGILNRAFAAMGFTWTPGGVLYDSGFEALAARGLQWTDSATYYAYTAALTVAGTATVPDTGDMNVVGIVMIAVAILTVAAVAVKKVRA